MNVRSMGLLGALAGSLACAGPGGGRDELVTGSGIATGPGVSGGHDDGDASGDDDGGDGDDGGAALGDLGGAAEGGFEECDALVEEAQVGSAGADIIIAIDNSVSMANEIASVQASMNAFSQQIASADVDPHVVMISGFAHNSDSGICVPPPLGSGMCPSADHNPPAYWRVGDWVGSHSALARIVQYYPDYAPTLRADAKKHVLVISDDSSDWTAAEFTAQLVALDPTLSEFVFHAIVNEVNGTYVQLATQTGGLVGDLSIGEFQPIFDELATEVVAAATLACEYEIPVAPEGLIFDPDEVNVEFSDGAGGKLQIGRVEDPSECGAVMDGWYYDDPLAPTTILVCPQTCEHIQGFALATIGVIFGCATIPAG